MVRKGRSKTVKSIEVEEAQRALARYVGQTARGPIVLVSGGKPVAALVSLEDIDLDSLSLSSNAKFLSIIERSRERENREGSISSKEIRRRLSSQSAETTRINFRNRNGQRVVERTKRAGTDHNQYVYVLECGDCGHKYGANGSDIHQRKCPKCQKGKPGLDT